MDKHVERLIRDFHDGTVPAVESLRVLIEVDEGTRRLLPCREDALFRVGSRKVSSLVPLKPVTELWTGDRVPPDFAEGPTAEYETFFLVIESTAAAYCRAAESPVRDREFERIYDYAVKRPDGRDRNPMFAYLVGAARLYMSLVDTSRAEYEAVMRRLKRSAGRFSEGPVSSNYYELALSRAGW